MSIETVFRIQLVFGYLAWLLCFGVYIWPWLRSAEQIAAHRAIATLHSFRIFGLAFLVPGVTGTHLPADFAAYAAYGDFATGVLAILALLLVRVGALFWPLVIAFNVVGICDLMIDYYHAIAMGLPAMAGELGSLYVIPIIYVPILMITHVAAFYLLLRPQAAAVGIGAR